MDVRTILVCEAQVPFVHGGAEIHVRELVRELRARGYQAELVSVPFKWYPKEEILPHAAAWRLLDLSESNGRPVDLVIASKFPTYFVRHPRKVAWLIHQYRAAYELCGTEYSDFAHTDLDVGLRETLIRLDTEMLGECRAIFSNARNTAARLKKYNGLKAEPLYHPSRLAAAAAQRELRPLRAVGGPHRVGQARGPSRPRDGPRVAARSASWLPATARSAATSSGWRQPRGCRTASPSSARSTTSNCVELYADALVVAYPPFDEDFGYVTLEAFLARKPVITCTDSGGPTEFVRDGVNGWTCEPDPVAVAAAITSADADRSRTAQMGDAGYDLARTITWDGVIEKLVG